MIRRTDRLPLSFFSSASGVAILAVAACSLAATPELSASDQAKIRAVSDAYCAAWLGKTPEQSVMHLFDKDAVLLPHHGVEPVMGDKAIRAFWFPKDAPPTTVTSLTQRIDEVGGSGDFAFIRGHSRVSWISGTGPDAKAVSLAGTFLTILRRQRDGSWLITHHTWDDPPPRAQ